MARPMKYYLYISDAKVDMLYGQRPRRLFSRVEEFRFGVKGVDVGIKNRVTEESRYAKLQLVVNYLTKHTKIGTVEAPGAYFRGTYPLSWGMLESASSLVFFGGVVNGVVLGLTGSPRHVLGAAQGQPTLPVAPIEAGWLEPVIRANDTGSYVYRPSDYHALRYEAPQYQAQPLPGAYPPAATISALTPPQPLYGAYPPSQDGSGPMPFPPQPAPPTPYMPQQIVRALGGRQTPDGTGSPAPSQTLQEEDANLALIVVQRAVERMRGAPQKLEFLAKTLLHGELPTVGYGPTAPTKVLLGTPVYVALAE